MKILVFILMLISVVACDPYGFGFKRNPAYILDQAFQAVTNQDLVTFLEVTGKEALCVYGNSQGISALKENLNLSPENVNITPRKLSATHYQNPVLIGNYWSYYNERYQIDIVDKITAQPLLKVLVDCDYGVIGKKDNKWVNLKPKKYKMRECKLVKIMPFKFQPLPAPEKCGLLMINL